MSSDRKSGEVLEVVHTPTGTRGFAMMARLNGKVCVRIAGMKKFMWVNPAELILVSNGDSRVPTPTAKPSGSAESEDIVF